jgi:hypothetical protein
MRSGMPKGVGSGRKIRPATAQKMPPVTKSKLHMRIRCPCLVLRETPRTYAK